MKITEEKLKKARTWFADFGYELVILITTY